MQETRTYLMKWPKKTDTDLWEAHAETLCQMIRGAVAQVDRAYFALSAM